MLGLQTRRGSNHSTAHVGESNSRSNVFQISRASVCVPSRWKVLSGEFRRRPTALVIKFRKPDRVGRRGLSEPREDFSRLITYAFLWLYSWLFPRLDFVAVKVARTPHHRTAKKIFRFDLIYYSFDCIIMRYGRQSSTSPPNHQAD